MNSSTVSHQRPAVDWWGEDLIAMMAKGFKNCGIGPIIMLYSQKSERFGKSLY